MEEEKNYTPILPPAKDEQPEEGFVPYCGSEEAEAESRQRNPKKKLFIIFALIIVMLLILAISLTARQFNYYNAVLNKLAFDYREGEAVYSDSFEESGSLAEDISEQLGNQQVRVNAAMYMFDISNEQLKLLNIMSEYEYTHNISVDQLFVKTGSDKSLFMKSFTYKKSASGYQKKKGSSWEADPEAYVPKLNEYFFGTAAHDGIVFSCEQSSDVEVGGKRYTCELWLMEDSTGSQTVYTTLYRYYSGNRLAGVRILFDYDRIMEVYDIKSYVIG